MTAYAEILERTDVVRRGEQQSDARCPAHDDHRPSLSIGAGPDRAFLKCQAGCAVEDVVAALGLPMAALFDSYYERTNGNGNAAPGRVDGNGRPPIEAVYKYVDEPKRLLFEVVRRRDKSFAQRRPDGAGGFVWKLGDRRRVLYRLPALLAAVESRETVYVCEGEKDVHALEAAGAVATCNPGGAGKWRPEYAETLRGARVVVIADRDEPGYRHAREVASSLEGVAAAVRVVEAVEGKDAHDHLQAGHGLEEFAEFTPVEQADTGALKGTDPRPELTYDAKGKLLLPPAPEGDQPAELCPWLTAVLALDPRHPVTAGAHEGLRGAAGHVELKRLDAPPLRFEPAGRINTPMKFIEDRTWQAIPTDQPTPPYKGEHCRVIAHVIRRLCGASRRMSDQQETAAIISAYVQGAELVEGYTTHGSSGSRYDAACALQRAVDETTGRPVGPARYILDANTGELVIRVLDLGLTARQYVGGSLARGWLDARMQNLGWTPGPARRARAARPGRQGRPARPRGRLPRTTHLRARPGGVTT